MIRKLADINPEAWSEWPDYVGYEQAKRSLPPMSPREYQRAILILAALYWV